MATDPTHTRRSARGRCPLLLLLALVATLAACGGAAAVPGSPWAGVDMIEIGRKGERAPLEPVPGRVTVFDFWAAWCAPCRDLDRELAALGRTYPGLLAVRKLEVVDQDSPVVQQHLDQSVTLPHVKVFGPDGTLRFEQSGTPKQIAAQVEALLRDDALAQP